MFPPFFHLTILIQSIENNNNPKVNVPSETAAPPTFDLNYPNKIQSKVITNKVQSDNGSQIVDLSVLRF